MERFPVSDSSLMMIGTQAPTAVGALLGLGFLRRLTRCVQVAFLGGSGEALTSPQDGS